MEAGSLGLTFQPSIVKLKKSGSNVCAERPLDKHFLVGY